jgi:hypothetical protein
LTVSKPRFEAITEDDEEEEEDEEMQEKAHKETSHLSSTKRIDEDGFKKPGPLAVTAKVPGCPCVL